MAAVIMCWIVGAMFGAVIVWKSPEMLGEYLAYIGSPTVIAISFYSWKAKAENLIKLSNEQIEKIKNIKE